MRIVYRKASLTLVHARAGLKPLHVVQPEGPSFSINGSSIAWQKWHMRMSFNHREGLVLHNIGCADAVSSDLPLWWLSLSI